MGNKTRQKTGIEQLGDGNRYTDVSIQPFDIGSRSLRVRINAD